MFAEKKSPTAVLDPAHGEGVYCVLVLLTHVPKLVREDIDQRLSTTEIIIRLTSCTDFSGKKKRHLFLSAA
jgi:hypothetical protein